MRMLVAGIVSALVGVAAPAMASTSGAAPAAEPTKKKADAARKKADAPAKNPDAADAKADPAPQVADAPAPKVEAAEARPEVVADKPAAASEGAKKPDEKLPERAEAPTPAPTPTPPAMPASGTDAQKPTPVVGAAAGAGPEVRVETVTAQQPLAKAPSIGEPPPLIEPAFPARPPEEEASAFRYELHGFVRAGYAFVLRDPGSFTVGQNSGFRLYNTRFGIQGGYGAHVRFDLSLDTVQSLDGATNQAPLTLGLRDANVAFSFGSAWFKVGQFKTPFNGELLLPDDGVAFSRRSLVSEGLAGDESRTPYGMLGLDRQVGLDLGARLALGEAAADVELAVVNGNGANQGRNDNRLPALVGRAQVGWRGSSLAVSGLWNDRTAGRLGNQQDERDLGLDVDATVSLFGARLFGMYVLQRTQFLTAPEQEPKTAWGAVGALSYALEAGQLRIEPAYRLAVYSPTDLIPDAALLDQTFGVNVYPSSLPVRVQAGYTLRTERIARTAPNDLAELVVQANF